MTITVNGKPRTLSRAMALSELLGELGLEPARVVVERNREIVARDAFAATPLADGDALEVVHFVGGG